MSWSKDIELMYGEYLSRYQSNKLLKHYKLKQFILKSIREAEENYKKLNEPKTCSAEIYILYWVRSNLEKDFAARTLRSPIYNENSFFSRAVKNHFSVFPPPQLIDRFSREVYSTQPYEKREVVWNNSSLPLGKIISRFKSLAIARNQMANQKKYTSHIDLNLDAEKIPRLSFEQFIKNIDRVIYYCNSQLPELDNLPEWFYLEYNTPCYICELKSFPFGNLNEVYDFVAAKYPVLKEYRRKVKIGAGDSSHMMYINESDSFAVTVDNNDNIRHKSVSLVHELGYVISFLRNFKKGVDPLTRGKYLLEKDALKIELALNQVLQKRSFQLPGAYFGNALLNFRRVLFEIGLFENPKQNLSKLYAETFNRCFKGAKQKSNPLYLLDKRIAMKPLSSLPYTIASSELFLK